MELNIACSTDDKYSVLCMVMLCSLLENNKKNHVIAHILVSHLSLINQTKILKLFSKYDNAQCVFHEVNVDLLKNCKYRTKLHKLSKAAYYRVLLASILKDVDRVIYLDCDMVVLSDLVPLLNIDMQNFGIAAVEDYGLPYNQEHFAQLEFSEGDKYFNSGFLLINLAYWRQHKIEKALIEFSESDRKVFFHDQDALNFVFRGSWIRLEPKWNHFNIFHIRLKDMFKDKAEYQAFFHKPCVIHYSDKYFKPWFKTPLIPFKNTWFKYLKLSAWNDFEYKTNDRPFYTIFKILYLHLEILMFKFKFKCV